MTKFQLQLKIFKPTFVCLLTIERNEKSDRILIRSPQGWNLRVPCVCVCVGGGGGGGGGGRNFFLKFKQI